MTVAEVIDALDLPSAARLDRRVPKKLLAESGKPTTADKRRIHEGVEEIIWVAALKPATVGVPAYRDEEREYLEIAVLSIEFRHSAKVARLVELIHRAIPYPVLLVSAHLETIAVSAAYKRRAQNEVGKIVLDEAVVEAALPIAGPLAPFEMFEAAAQPKTNLRAMYQGWIECIEAVRAGTISGEFRRSLDGTAAEARRHALAQHARIADEIDALRSQAAREGQIARRVELNLAIRRLEQELAEVRKHL